MANVPDPDRERFEAWFKERTVWAVGSDQHYWAAQGWQEAVRQERERQEALRRAGAMLSNCAFNLAQRNPGQFTARDIEALDSSRKAWDDAIRARSEQGGEG